MKRLNAKQRLRLIRHAKSSEKRRLRSKLKQKIKRRASQIHASPHADIRLTTPLGEQTTILAPEVFSLTSNFAEVTGCVKRLRERAVVQRRPVWIDLRPVEYLGPAAAVMLAAEVDMWQRTMPTKLRAIAAEEWNPTVRRLLAEIGFFDLLGTPDAPIPGPYAEQSVQFLKLETGSNTDMSWYQRMRPKLEECAWAFDRLEKNRLYDALTEAIENTVQHAYGGAATSWWAAGFYDRSQERLSLIVYDRGVGIPATLKNSKVWSTIEKKVGSMPGIRGLLSDDARLIEAAIESRRTASGQFERGLGMAKILNYVSNRPSARLRILSRRGDYLYETGSSPFLTNHRRSLGGTLIQWDVVRSAL